MIDLDRELSVDAGRVLAYVVGCIKSGRRLPPSPEALCEALDPPLSWEALLVVLDELRAAGLGVGNNSH